MPTGKIKHLAFALLILNLLLLAGCGEPFHSDDFSDYDVCSSDQEWIGSSFGDGTGRLAFQSSNLWILDGMGDVRHFSEDPFAGCSFTSTSYPSYYETSSFASDIGVLGGQFAVWDPTGRLYPPGDTLDCSQGGEVFALRSPLIAVSDGNANVDILNSSTCSQNSSYSTFGNVLTMDFSSDGLWVVEGSSPSALSRLSLYSDFGTLIQSSPMDIDPSSENYLCSATRLRTLSTRLALLDGTCNQLAFWDRNGNWLGIFELPSSLRSINWKDFVQNADGDFLLSGLTGSQLWLYKFHITFSNLN